MVVLNLLIIAVCISVYYIGRIINKFVKEELKNKSNIFEKLVYLTPLIIALISLTTNLISLNLIILSLLLSLVPILVPKKQNDKYHNSIISIFLGLILGVDFSSYILIIIICIYFYFNANLDYYKAKEKHVFKHRIIEQIIFAGFAIASMLLNLFDLKFAAAVAIIVLYIKENLSKKANI